MIFHTVAVVKRHQNGNRRSDPPLIPLKKLPDEKEPGTLGALQWPAALRRRREDLSTPQRQAEFVRDLLRLGSKKAPQMVDALIKEYQTSRESTDRTRQEATALKTLSDAGTWDRLWQEYDNDLHEIDGQGRLIEPDDHGAGLAEVKSTPSLNTRMDAVVTRQTRTDEDPTGLGREDVDRVLLSLYKNNSVVRKAVVD